MKLPLTITAHDMELTEAAEALIRSKAFKLEKYNGRVIGCHVTVQGPGRHHRNGGLYEVRIDLTVPGHEYVINHQSSPELAVAVRDAFDAARRKLDEDREMYLERRKDGRKPFATETEGEEEAEAV